MGRRRKARSQAGGYGFGPMGPLPPLGSPLAPLGPIGPIAPTPSLPSPTRPTRSSSKRYKYLGKKVKDVGAQGLDRPSEFEGITEAILEAYESGEIDERTARGQLLLLLRLTYPKNNRKVRGWSPRTRERIRKMIRKAMTQL